MHTPPGTSTIARIMAEPSPGADAHLSRRERRVGRSKARWKRIVTITVTVLLLVGFGLVITETVRFGGADRPSLAGTVVATPRSNVAGAPTTTIPGRPCRSPLNDTDPLRLWIGGDSLAGSLGPALGTIAGGTGVVQPQFDSRVSSGLSNRSFFDWPEHAAKEMARLNPEIAVFFVGANDFAVPLDTTQDAQGQPAWKAQYAAWIEEMLAALGSDTRTVIWIAPPSFQDNRNAQIKELDDLMRDVLARHASAAYVDTYALFTDADGKYQGSLPPLDDPNGAAVVVRAGDGVHFSTLGADRLAKAVFPLIDAQCKVTAQAIAGVVKGTIQTEGSTLVVGGTTRGGTVQTSPPATSPPAPQVTSPPATSPPVETTTPAPVTTVPITTPTTAT